MPRVCAGGAHLASHPYTEHVAQGRTSQGVVSAARIQGVVWISWGYGPARRIQPSAAIQSILGTQISREVAIRQSQHGAITGPVPKLNTINITRRCPDHPSSLPGIGIVIAATTQVHVYVKDAILEPSFGHLIGVVDAGNHTPPAVGGACRG